MLHTQLTEDHIYTTHALSHFFLAIEYTEIYHLTNQFKTTFPTSESFFTYGVNIGVSDYC